MKKIILGMLLLFAVSSTITAQEKTVVTSGTKYWYYPVQNIYFNEVTGNYWFYDNTRTEWIEASKLPDWLTMADTDTRYEIYYKGPKVWKENKQHKIKYKIKKDGTIKEKSE